MQTYTKSYAEQLEDLAEEYREETGATSINLNELAAWAYTGGKLKPRFQDITKLLANQFGRALRSIHKKDPQGRLVRSHLPVPFRVDNQQVFEWFKPENMSYAEMQASSQYRRGLIANDVKQLNRDNTSWNENYSDGPTIQMSFNFIPDVIESELPDTHPDFEAEASDDNVL